MNSTTLVTAFYNVYENDHKLGWSEQRKEWAKQLFELPIPIMVFCDSTESKELLELLTNRPLTTIINKKKTEFQCWQTIQNMQMQLRLPNVRNPYKDTPYYMALVNCKPEIMMEAATQNPYNTTHFAWVDMGIAKITSTSAIMKELYHSLSRPNQMQGLVLPGIWEHVQHHIEQPNWRFAGGIFLGQQDAIISFGQICIKYYASFLEETQTHLWEVNYWAWLEKHGLLPQPYKWLRSDHNDTLIQCLAS